MEGLKPLNYRVMLDRIDAGMLMTAAAITRGDVRIEEDLPEHNAALIDKLREAGASVEEDGNRAVRGRKSLSGAQVMATDLRAGPRREGVTGTIRSPFSSLRREPILR